MRIKTFGKFVEVSELMPRVLRDEPVVLDGQNLFYSSYQEGRFSGIFGIEADRYARYLREYLAMFKKANVKCYFLFKGGHEDMEKRLTKRKDGTTVPVLLKETYKEVLKEMGFELAMCEYESKKDIIELAEKLDCPIISYDIHYCFTGLQYIPSTTLELQSDNSIQCGYFLLGPFLRKHNLTIDKVSIFIVLTDQHIFPEGSFTNFFNSIKAPLGPYKRNLHLLRWLSKNNREQILSAVLEFMGVDDKKTIVEEEAKVRKFIERRESGGLGLGAACLLDRDAARVARADPRWFVKGVAAGHVAIDYVNLYRSKIFFGALPMREFEQHNATLVSVDIIKYAYDLLTNFQNDGYDFVYDTGLEKLTVPVGDTPSIPKPAYEAEVCVFENGWESVRALGLLEHFSCSALQLGSLRRLERVPAQARLLLLALAYCARRRPAAPAALPTAALLTHLVLDVVADKCDKDNLPKLPFERKSIIDSTTDISDVTDADCGIAAAIMENYFNVSDSDTELLDQRLLHALAEFQSCLLQLSALNALCGHELPAPLLARSYNGALAYNLLRAAERAQDRVTFLDELLSPAPTVYAYFNGLLEAYEDILQLTRDE